MYIVECMATYTTPKIAASDNKYSTLIKGSDVISTFIFTTRLTLHNHS